MNNGFVISRRDEESQVEFFVSRAEHVTDWTDCIGDACIFPTATDAARMYGTIGWDLKKRNIDQDGMFRIMGSMDIHAVATVRALGVMI